MKAFNFDVDISVEHRDDETLIVFDDETLGVNPTSDGFTLTPDWNDHRFTLALSEDSVLYHLTDEAIGEKTGPGDIQPEGFIAEVYMAVRAVSALHPIRDYEFDTVRKIDFDRMQSFLEEWGVVEKTTDGIDVDDDQMNRLAVEYTYSRSLRKEITQTVLNPVSIDEAIESGEIIYAVPDADYVPYLLLLFPDEYAGLCRPWELLSLIDQPTGSRPIDLVARTVSR